MKILFLREDYWRKSIFEILWLNHKISLIFTLFINVFLLSFYLTGYRFGGNDERNNNGKSWTILHLSHVKHLMDNIVHGFTDFSLVNHVDHLTLFVNRLQQCWMFWLKITRWDAVWRVVHCRPWGLNSSLLLVILCHLGRIVIRVLFFQSWNGTTVEKSQSRRSNNYYVISIIIHKLHHRFERGKKSIWWYSSRERAIEYVWHVFSILVDVSAGLDGLLYILFNLK